MNFVLYDFAQKLSFSPPTKMFVIKNFRVSEMCEGNTTWLPLNVGKCFHELVYTMVLVVKREIVKTYRLSPENILVLWDGFTFRSFKFLNIHRYKKIVNSGCLRLRVVPQPQPQEAADRSRSSGYGLNSWFHHYFFWTLENSKISIRSSKL